MSINTASVGEKIWLDYVNLQAQKALRANLIAVADKAIDKTIDTAGNTIAEASRNYSGNDNLKAKTIPPADKNGDGEISKEEYRHSLNTARELLASLNNHSSQIRAYEARNIAMTPDDGLAATA